MTKLSPFEMRARGYDVSVAGQQSTEQEHYAAGLELIPIISEVFAGVVLGSGIGLSEADALDDYADAVTCARCREADEKVDWASIPTAALCQHQCALSYFDAEGMRFHLPTFLIADLRDEYGFGMAFCLAHVAPVCDEPFSLLTPEQRIAVRLFLLHILHSRDYQFDQPHIQRALDDYWTWPASIEP